MGIAKNFGGVKGVPHGSDLAFWWKIPALGPFGQEEQLSRIMKQALLDFAKCPAGAQCKIGGSEGSQFWPAYNLSAHGVRVNLRLPVSRLKLVYDDKNDDMCAFFRSSLNKPNMTMISMPSNKTIDDFLKDWNIDTKTQTRLNEFSKRFFEFLRNFS